MPREEDDLVADQEERMINEEYKIWKKNTPFLYGARGDSRGSHAVHKLSIFFKICMMF
jgi:hypothetical protein